SLLQSSALHRPPHPFPTRRSSDLAPTPTQSFDSSTKIEQVIREFTVRHLQQHTTYRHVCDSDTRFGRFVLPAWKGRDIRSITKGDRKSTRLNSSHVSISYAVFCLK